MKTLVFGYSESPERYSNMAAHLLADYKHEVITINPRQERDLEKMQESSTEDIHTLTLYVNPTVSEKYQDILLKLKPKRVIFNPGTESASLEEKFEAQGSEVVIGCTLVMLRTQQF